MISNLKAIAVGRLVPVKRFDLLIEAWKDIPLQISIVGDGPEREALASKVIKFSLQDRVHFLGERTDIQELLADHQLLVVTSDREGFGYVVLEALQAKLVVVSTSTGIATDLLPNNYLVESLTAGNVSAKIQRTLRNFEQAKRDFRPVWESVQELTIMAMVAETLDFYRETVSR